jgi:hypothetical protein
MARWRERLRDGKVAGAATGWQGGGSGYGMARWRGHLFLQTFFGTPCRLVELRNVLDLDLAHPLVALLHCPHEE